MAQGFRRWTRSTLTAGLLLLVLGCVAADAVAQAAVEVRGLVTDETGGLIAGATVTLTDAGTPMICLLYTSDAADE